MLAFSMISLCNIFRITRRSRRLDTTEITTLSRTTMQGDAALQLQLLLHVKLRSAVLLSSHMAYPLHLPVTVTLLKMLSKRRSLPHHVFATNSNVVCEALTVACCAGQLWRHWS